MYKKEAKEFIKDFRQKLENSKTIEIKEDIKNNFEQECLKKVSSYANSVHNWREKSLRSCNFVF